MMIVAQLAMCYLAASLTAMVWLSSPAQTPPANSSSSVAGTWEDDPRNWYRAFEEEQPADVTVIHSHYWRSDHWTYEYTYFFEVKASDEWRDDFLKKRNAKLLPASKARSYWIYGNKGITPNWFAPGPVSEYEVWDERPGYFGSIWINKSNGHIFFWDRQV